jgi:E3 ubiquitin-protein ligase HUWE1
VWFFEIIESYTKADIALLMQFVTGSSQIPLDGFGSLQGMSGQQNFNIHKLPSSVIGLPKSHTCFN